MINSTLKASLLFVVVFGFSAFADWSDRRPESYTVSDPPQAGSLEEHKEFEVLHDWEKRRTAQDCDFARAAMFPSVDIFWKQLFFRYVELKNLNAPFTATELQELRPFLSKVSRYTERVTDFYKEKYHRARPYDADPTLRPCAVRPGGRKSYPSSHASTVVASACILADRYPKAKDLLMEYGEYMADLRMIGGVHHPSDVATGKSIGLQVCENVLSD